MRRSARVRKRSVTGKEADNIDFLDKIEKWTRKHNAVVKQREILMKRRRKARSKEAEVILSTMIKKRIEMYSSEFFGGRNKGKRRQEGQEQMQCAQCRSDTGGTEAKNNNNIYTYEKKTEW